MSSALSWLLRIVLIVCAILYVVIYADADSLFGLVGFYSFLLYSVLSLITGLRYRNLVLEISHRKFSASDIFLVPAAMNFASYILPFKGGSLWLFFYLKTRYKLSSLKSAVLALFNLVFLFSVTFLVIVFSALGLGFSYFYIFLFFFFYFIILSLSKRFLYKLRRYSVSWHFVFLDSVLVSLHFLVLAFLCFMIVSPQDFLFSFYFGLFLLVASLVKITPGNIGILEGLAIVGAKVIPEYGSLLPELVAVYRTLSIAHAIVAGAPSMLFLTFRKKGEGNY